MKNVLKRTLLRFGGYALAKHAYASIERRKLIRRVNTFSATGQTPLPDTVMFEVTQRCNLRCKMCFQDRDILARQHELSLEQLTTFFDQNPYLKKVILIGGEPFVRKDMQELIQHLDQTRDLVISTNGTLLSDNDIQMLRRCRHLMTVCISLDGPEPVHDAIRGVKGAYKKAVHTITSLVEDVPVTVTCVIQGENLHTLPEMVTLCANMGVKKLKFEFERIYSEDAMAQAMHETALIAGDIPISSAGRERAYPLETLKKTLKHCRQAGQKAGIYVMFDPPFLLQELHACYTASLRKDRHYISQSFRMATIAPNGDVIQCYAIRKPFGNIQDMAFEDIWNADTAIRYRQQLLNGNLTQLCENCPFLVVSG